MAKKETIVVKDLQVKVTYTVGYGNVEMPKSIYKALLETAEEGDCIEMGEMDKEELCSWLQANVKEKDCYNWEAEIEDISEHKV
jgi:hypothetical protein